MPIGSNPTGSKSKTQSEIDRNNRMFAIEQAVKLGVVEGGKAPVDNARDFHEFLDEAGPIDTTTTGFTV